MTWSSRLLRAAAPCILYAGLGVSVPFAPTNAGTLLEEWGKEVIRAAPEILKREEPAQPPDEPPADTETDYQTPPKKTQQTRPQSWDNDQTASESDQPSTSVIRETQQLLNELGYAAGTPDGVMGRRTKRAIEQYQADSGLAVTGIPDDKLMRHLKNQRAKSASTPSRSAEPSFDCNAAVNVTEIAICDSITLAALDREISDAYGAAFSNASSSERTKLKAEQARWMKARNSCGGEIDCLERSMAKRLDALRGDVRLAGAEEPSGSARDNERVAGAAEPEALSTEPQREVIISASAEAPAREAELSFAAPEPDYLALLSHYMAANPDELDTDAFAWLYYLRFVVGGGEDENAAIKRCDQLGTKLRNSEFARKSALKDAKQRLAADKEAIAARPKTGIYRLKARKTIKEYDFDANAFPLEDAMYSISDGEPFSVASEQGALIRVYDVPAPRMCGAMYVTRYEMGPMPGINAVPENFKFRLPRPELLSRLDMPPEDAEAFLERNGGRSLEVEFLVEIGPLTTAAPEEPSEVRILSARLLSPADASVIRTFGREHFEPAGQAAKANSEASKATKAAGVAAAKHLLLRAHYLGLLTVRDNPSVVDGEALLEFTARHIEMEQRSWQILEKFLKEQKKSKNAVLIRNNIDPKDPTLLIEWQGLHERKGGVSDIVLRDIFVPLDEDWSELNRLYKPKSKNEFIRQAFVFKRETIEGRDAAFAARELLELVQAQVREAAPHTPTALYFQVELPYFDYDFKLQSLRFSESERANILSVPERVAYANAPPSGNDSSNPYFVLPPALQDFVIYRFDTPDTARDHSRRSVPLHLQQAYNDSTPAALWQNFLPNYLPLTMVLAFDRTLEIPPVKFAPAKAERLMSEIKRTGERVTARVNFEIDQVALGFRQFSNQYHPMGAPIARLSSVDILRRDGTLIVQFPADAFQAIKPIRDQEKATQAAAKAAEEQAAKDKQESEKKAKAALETKLQSLLPAGAKTILVRVAGSEEISTVYALDRPEKDMYDKAIRERNFDLPNQTLYMHAADMESSLRASPGIAILLPMEVFAKDVFPRAADLNLVVAAFPEGADTPLRDDVRKRLDSLIPADQRIVLVSRNDGPPTSQVFIQIGEEETYRKAADEWQARVRVSGGDSWPLPPTAVEYGLRDLAEILANAPGARVVARRDGLGAILHRLDAVELSVQPFPPAPGEDVSGVTGQADTRDASEFPILGLKVGDDEAAALQAVQKELPAAQVTHDTNGGTILVERGACDFSYLGDVGTAQQIGAFCLAIRLTSGRVTSIGLRQVVKGNVIEKATAAFKERYGAWTIEDGQDYGGGNKQTLLGWGVRLGQTREAARRGPGNVPVRVLEAQLWLYDGITTVVLQVDEAAKQAMTLEPPPDEIKF